jgi:hypothetical protein
MREIGVRSLILIFDREIENEDWGQVFNLDI